MLVRHPSYTLISSFITVITTSELQSDHTSNSESYAQWKEERTLQRNVLVSNDATKEVSPEFDVILVSD